MATRLFSGKILRVLVLQIKQKLNKGNVMEQVKIEESIKALLGGCRQEEVLEGDWWNASTEPIGEIAPLGFDVNVFVYDTLDQNSPYSIIAYPLYVGKDGNLVADVSEVIFSHSLAEVEFAGWVHNYTEASTQSTGLFVQESAENKGAILTRGQMVDAMVEKDIEDIRGGVGCLDLSFLNSVLRGDGAWKQYSALSDAEVVAEFSDRNSHGGLDAFIDFSELQEESVKTFCSSVSGERLQEIFNANAFDFDENESTSRNIRVFAESIGVKEDIFGGRDLDASLNLHMKITS
jgi:hypothetical protein